MILIPILFLLTFTVASFKSPAPVSQTSREIEAKALSTDKREL